MAIGLLQMAYHIQMKQKEITKTFKMLSNWKKTTFGLLVYRNHQTIQRYLFFFFQLLRCIEQMCVICCSITGLTCLTGESIELWKVSS